MRRELSQAELERLFVGAVDGALAEEDARLLEHDAELKAQYGAYARAVHALRDAPRHQAPDGLATLILARTRRRRLVARTREAGLFAALPAEVVVPLVIAALVAVFMLLASP